MKEYRQHWWKCDGPCQHRPPFFGTVKRAMNRAPSAQDRWWAEHQKTCGGTYSKIKEPEGYKSRADSGTKVAHGGNKGNGSSTAGKNSKSIKDLFNGASGKKDDTNSVGPSVSQAVQSVSASHVKPFEGRGQRLVDAIDVDAEPRSVRETILAAAEKRMKRSQNRGKRKKGASSGTSHTPSHDIRRHGIISTDLDQGKSSNPKKPKLSTSLSDSDSDCCIILDADSPPSSSSSVGGAMGDPSASIIDLDDTCEDDSTESLPAPWDDDDVIAVDAESSDGDGLKTCPVCGRSDIPAVIINTHIAFCLDEEIESATVDDDHL